MWSFLGHTLFPPLTQAWLQRASSDPGAQGWGAWSRAEEPPPEPGDGAGKEEAPAEAEDDPEDAGFPLPPLEGEDLAEYPEPDQVTARGAQQRLPGPGFNGTDGCSSDLSQATVPRPGRG